jgi:hypothetical protein
MVLRKIICFFIILACLLVWGNMASVRAGESDALINILKKKGILSQDEADKILEEMRASTQKEKAEVKTEAKTEIKDDIKKAAGAGEFLPSALKGFKFGSTIFMEWNTKNYKDPQGGSNQFNLNRAYLTLSKEINDWMGLSATADLFTSKDSGDKGNGLELRLKYANMYLKFYDTITQIGMIGTPSDTYDSAIWPFRVQGKHLIDDAGIQASADIGISNQGVLGGYMDDEYLKFASEPFAGKWGGYMVGVYNGPGYTYTESNNNKVISGVVYLRPFPTVSILKGIQLAYVGTYGKSNEKFASGDTTEYPDWKMNVGQISLQHQYFTVMAQYYRGKGTSTSTEDKDRKGYLVEAFTRIPGLEKLRIFGRYYYYDPDIDTDNDGWKKYVAGLAYDVTREFMLFIAWERLDNEPTNGSKDYNQFQAGFQLKF